MRIDANRFIGLVVPLLLQASVANAGKIPQSPQVGDIYEITLKRHNEGRNSDGSSASSNDKDTFIEQVTGVRPDGLELQYDLANSPTAGERPKAWQFPARVFKPSSGPVTLLNGIELEARIEGWLNAASLPRTACGHWIVTWTAFRIECDPQSVIRTIQSIELGSESLHEGGLYRDSKTGSSGTLARRSGSLGGEIFNVEMPVDVDAVRHAHAESDVIIGEFMMKPVTLEASLQKRAGEVVSGTIYVALETDLAGNVHRKTTITTLDTKGVDGNSEKQTSTETIERRRISLRD